MKGWRLGFATALASLAVCGSLASPVAADPASTFRPISVLLVRHAEKAAEPKEDPLLSEAGQRRAEALARLVERAGLTAILASEWQRTQLTVKPAADRLGLTIEVVPAKDPAATAAAILAHPGGRLLVAGHSNTLGPILEALGSPPIPEIPDSEYDNLFLATILAPGEVQVLRLRLP